MEYKNILQKSEDGISIIIVNRPDKLNAIDNDTISEIGIAVEQAVKNDEIKGIILTGSGEKAFVAGADISRFLECSVKEGSDLSRHGHNVFNSIENCPKPVIAAVNGFALGGGCELAMACHMRVASENARFGQPEVNLGLIPGYGATQRLIHLIGKSKAVELLMTADLVSAEGALKLGLVNYVTTADQLIPKAKEILGKIKTKSPMAISAIIRCTNANYRKDVNGFEMEIDEFGKCFGTADFREGVTAFLEKRKASFPGK